MRSIMVEKRQLRALLINAKGRFSFDVYSEGTEEGDNARTL